MRPVTRTFSNLHAAELAPMQQRADPWRRLVEMYSYFTEYQQRTSREIPVVILTSAGAPESPEK